MGNCIRKCFAGFDRRRKYLRTRYDVEREASIEFENLMDDDTAQTEMSKLITERETQLLTSKQYNALLHDQKQKDDEIDRKLHEQEEELRREEEAYYEAKREAARIARLQKAKEEEAKSKPTSNHNRAWLGEHGQEWGMAGGEDDFETFLASVKARSLKATAHLRKGSNDGVSSNSSSTNTPQTRDRSHTEGSSLDLEWEHEDGVIPVQRKPRSSTEENLSALANKRNESPALSNDFEWDMEFTASEDKDTQNLLSAEYSISQQSPAR